MTINVIIHSQFYQYTPNNKKDLQEIVYRSYKIRTLFHASLHTYLYYYICGEDTLNGGSMQSSSVLSLRFLIISRQYQIDISTMKTQL